MFIIHNRDVASTKWTYSTAQPVVWNLFWNILDDLLLSTPTTVCIVISCYINPCGSMATVSEGTANPLVIIPQSHFLGRYGWIHREITCWSSLCINFSYHLTYFHRPLLPIAPRHALPGHRSQGNVTAGKKKTTTNDCLVVYLPRFFGRPFYHCPIRIMFNKLSEPTSKTSARWFNFPLKML